MWLSQAWGMIVKGTSEPVGVLREDRFVLLFENSAALGFHKQSEILQSWWCAGQANKAGIWQVSDEDYISNNQGVYPYVAHPDNIGMN